MKRRILASVLKLCLAAATLGGGAVATAVVTAQPAGACTYGPYSYSLGARIGWYWGVHHFGDFYANPDAGCGVSINAYGQRKVCGFWGCSFEDKASSGWFQPNGTYTQAYTGQPCIAGTNRYRTEFDANYLGGPYYYGSTIFSDEPEYAC